MKFRAFAAVAAGALLATTLNVVPAQAGGSSSHDSTATVKNVATLIDGLTGPLRVAHGPGGNILVAESFAGLLSSVSPNGTKKVFASSPGNELAAVSYTGGTTYYFENLAAPAEDPTALAPALLKTIDKKGQNPHAHRSDQVGGQAESRRQNRLRGAQGSAKLFGSGSMDAVQR